MILSGSESQVFAHTLSRRLDEPVLPVSYRRFPDGELIVEVQSDGPLPTGVTLGPETFELDDRAVVVASTLSARSHLEVVQLQDLAMEAGAESIITVIPYLGYARQDVAHEPGQPVSARAVAKALGATTDRVVTVNPHGRSVLDHFQASAEAVSAVGALAGGLALESDTPLIVAPDEGARPLATQLVDAIGRGTVDHFEKERVGDAAVEISTRDTDVSGREVVLIDDTIATGGTIATATKALFDGGADSVSVACVHPLLVGDAYTRLKRAGVEQIVGTDTIERTVSSVSAAPAVSDVL